MRPFDSRSYYDVLEISADAHPEEVERAYRIAAATYGDESLATYSLLDEEDVRAARESVELAYEVLSDPVARQRYDAEREPEPDEVEERVAAEVPELDELLASIDDEAPPPPRPREPVLPALEGFADVDEEAGGVYDGPRLRRARLLRGVEIGQIADVTKVNPTYLRFIEDDRFDDLPATVYVRGFVTAYARCLGLEPLGVSLSYVERMEQHRGEGETQKGWGR